MNWQNSEDITFQLTGKHLLPGLYVHSHLCDIVGQLTLSSQLLKEDICVTVTVDNVSKITCCGELSKDCLTVTWNHPFLL